MYTSCLFYFSAGLLETATGAGIASKLSVAESS